MGQNLQPKKPSCFWQRPLTGTASTQAALVPLPLSPASCSSSHPQGWTVFTKSKRTYSAAKHTLMPKPIQTRLGMVQWSHSSWGPQMLPDTKTTQKRKWPPAQDRPLWSPRQQAAPSAPYTGPSLRKTPDANHCSLEREEDPLILPAGSVKTRRVVRALLTPLKALQKYRCFDSRVQSTAPLGPRQKSPSILPDLSDIFLGNSDGICFKDSNGIGLTVFRTEYSTQSRKSSKKGWVSTLCQSPWSARIRGHYYHVCWENILSKEKHKVLRTKNLFNI